jgi:DNA-binding HxlR family transcriptional regulator
MAAMRKNLRDMLHYLVEAGAVVERVDFNGSHPKVYYTIGERRCRLTVAGSPSDRRALQNFKADVKRSMKG